MSFVCRNPPLTHSAFTRLRPQWRYMNLRICAKILVALTHPPSWCYWPQTRSAGLSPRSRGGSLRLSDFPSLAPAFLRESFDAEVCSRRLHLRPARVSCSSVSHLVYVLCKLNGPLYVEGDRLARTFT